MKKAVFRHTDASIGIEHRQEGCASMNVVALAPLDTLDTAGGCGCPA